MMFASRLTLSSKGLSGRWQSTGNICMVLCGLFLFESVNLAQDTSLPDPKLSWEIGPTGCQASLRGLAAPQPNVVWACGSGATVIRSVDGGASWTSCGPDTWPELEYRSIFAWNESRACIASAGSPAVILRTQDGGSSWQEVFRHASPAAFFDGLHFWDAERGIAFSDPVDGKLLLVETRDGGNSWQVSDPDLIAVSRPGEAGFAASNSALLLDVGGRAWIGTGGATSRQSRIYSRSSWQAEWQALNCPLPSASTQGIFSLASDGTRLVAVGGDYRPDQVSPVTAAVSSDGGRTWKLPAQPPSAYRSAVSWVVTSGHSFWLAVGPSGSDWSGDVDVWTQFSPHGFHALATVDDAVFAVGSQGKFARLAIAND